MNRLLRASLAGLVLSILVVLGGAGPAAAHATLASSDPVDGAVLAKAPEQATLTFTESVALPQGGVRLYDADGTEREVTASALDRTVTVALPGGLSRGSHVLTWRVTSADGHPVAGSITFAIGEPSASVVRPDGDDGGMVRHVVAVVTAAAYLALFLALGVVGFWRFLLPGTQRLAPAGQRLLRMVRIAAVVGAVAWVLVFWVRAAAATQSGLGALLRPGDWTWSTPELAASLLTASALLALRWVTDLWPIVAAMLAGAVGPALAGHTRAFDPQLPVIVTDVVHVAAGSAWFGGSVALAIVLPRLAGRRQAGELVARFSTLAAGVLVALAASGALLAWRIVGSWEALVETTYGRVLLAKVAVVVVVVLFAAWNRFVLLPRARATVGHEAERQGLLAIGRVVRAEAVLLVAVLALSAVLVDRAPRVEEAFVVPGQPATRTLVLGEAEVHLTLEPARVGANTLSVHVEYPEGAPLTKPTLSVSGGGNSLGEQRLEIVGHGAWTSRIVLPTSGDWEFRMGMRLTKFDNPVDAVSFEVR
ncbi:CopD family protein [Nocardioides sp. Bht2]|uniref:copper resistance CopC/CopD family protein n=1 Tax=Nocardioides sp. Bht2 TaxID=3392297 RepID=UPI0039B384BD